MRTYSKISIVLLSLFIIIGSSTASGKLKLVILHTNDTHSQVEPRDKSTLASSDMGGYARRMGVINKIRAEEKNVLLFDAGDFSQGSPYFNFYNGRIEIDAINKMKYDAITLGNHEFDNGIDTLAVILSKATVPVVSSNYEISQTAIAPYVKPYYIIRKFGLKIGIIGLCVQPKSLIIESNHKGLTYDDPIEIANKMATFLKKEKKCDLIICLSHLGSDKKSEEVNDFVIARNTKYIDVIIGGHSHSMIEDERELNLDGKEVLISQMAKSGLYLGRIDLEMERKK